ncbi:MAG: BMC domain-containing protein [Planctomycetes bacterium]|nr:BMC domain-containing protein [Planctomycetota bacterium]
MRPAEDRALGLIEVASIPRGVVAADALIKEAVVTVLVARPVDPARWVLLFEGEVEAVQRAAARAAERAGDRLVGRLELAAPHPQLLSGLFELRQPEIDAVGLLETINLADCLAALDRALKAAEVELIELRLAMGLFGHAFFSITGEVSSVEAALEAGRTLAEGRGGFHDASLIPNPDPLLVRHLLEPRSPFSPFP